MNPSPEIPFDSRRLTRWVGAFVMCAGILVGCDSSDSKPTPQIASFEKNAEAVRFVRTLREDTNSGKKPSPADVQQLKELALQYPGESFIEEIHTSLLQGHGDWEGISAYLEAKEELTEEERFTLTRAYLRIANYTSAQAAIQGFAAAHAESVEAHLLLGRSHYFLGEHAPAEAAYDKVWEKMLSQGHTTDIAYKAMILFDRGEPGQALPLLRGALQAAPNSIPVLNSLSRVLAAVGEVDEAQTHSATVARLQDAFSKETAHKERRASRIFALNKALGAGDLDGCERMIFNFLEDANEGFADELLRFLERLYRQAGRESELTDVLKRARSVRQ
jgi:tetratricopeptide (TPR) repeat protein